MKKKPKCSDPKLQHDCTGCTDRHSEGTHQGCTKQHGHVGCALAKSDGWPVEKVKQPRARAKIPYCLFMLMIKGIGPVQSVHGELQVFDTKPNALIKMRKLREQGKIMIYGNDQFNTKDLRILPIGISPLSPIKDL